MIGGVALLAAPAARAAVLSDPGGELSLQVTIGGKKLLFRERGGDDLGDFHGKGFVQRCVRSQQSGTPLSAMFRRDRDSERSEVVVELGRIWQDEPAHLGAYTATILRGERELATVNVPAHYWHSRWRWASAPRPQIAKVEELQAKGLIPPYVAPGAGLAGGSARGLPSGGRGLPGGGGLTASIRRRPDGSLETAPASSKAAEAVGPHDPVYQVMGMAGITPYFPTTGEHPEIGPVTEVQGAYLCTGTQEAFTQCMAQAEASGTVPWHKRDERTGAPIDLMKYPNGNWYEPRVGSPFVKWIQSPIASDSAHSPSLSYVPYLLTGDPYYLEELQFEANNDLGAKPGNIRLGSPILSGYQTREHAWILRNQAQAAVATPDQVPGWLLPRSYWKHWLAVDLAWLEAKVLNNPAHERSVFRVIESSELGPGDEHGAPYGTWYSPWQDEFEAYVQGWMVLAGFAERLPVFRWKVGSTIARTNGKSGWLRTNSTPYRLKVRANKNVPVVATWGEAWELSYAGFRNIYIREYTDPNTFLGLPGYLGYTRGVLAVATHLDIPEAAECYKWADSELRRLRFHAYRWSIVPKA